VTLLPLLAQRVAVGQLPAPPPVVRPTCHLARVRQLLLAAVAQRCQLLCQLLSFRPPRCSRWRSSAFVFHLLVQLDAHAFQPLVGWRAAPLAILLHLLQLHGTRFQLTRWSAVCCAMIWPRASNAARCERAPPALPAPL
jgi:hypothetical protein